MLMINFVKGSSRFIYGDSINACYCQQIVQSNRFFPIDKKPENYTHCNGTLLFTQTIGNCPYMLVFFPSNSLSSGCFEPISNENWSQNKTLIQWKSSKIHRQRHRIMEILVFTLALERKYPGRKPVIEHQFLYMQLKFSAMTRKGIVDT